MLPAAARSSSIMVIASGCARNRTSPSRPLVRPLQLFCKMSCRPPRVRTSVQPMSQQLLDLPIKIFADGADREGIAALYAKPYIKGLTTNPTLMRKVGIADYEKVAGDFRAVVQEKPISFEVLSDEFPEMRRQARKIGRWQEN